MSGNHPDIGLRSHLPNVVELDRPYPLLSDAAVLEYVFGEYAGIVATKLANLQANLDN